MAVCSYCFEEMLAAPGCTATMHVEGVPVRRHPYGTEPYWGRPKRRCGDCGVLPGSLHHPGCDVERCAHHPWQQAISCDCRYDEDTLVFEEDLPEWAESLVQELERPSRGRLPLASLAVDARARHARRLATIETWVRGRGDELDGDAAALFLQALGVGTGEEPVELTRPLVLRALRGLTVMAVQARVALPDDTARTVVHVLGALEGSGQLAGASDPLWVLLEPVLCSFAPPDAAAEHHRHCQCFVADSVPCPPGAVLANTMAGELVPVLVGDGAPPLEAAAAVARFVDSVAVRWRGDVGLHPDGLDDQYLGEVPATEHHPRLWAYVAGDVPGRYDGLFLDDDGVAHVTWPDRRYRCGYRWDPLDPLDAWRRLHLDHRFVRTPVAG